MQHLLTPPAFYKTTNEYEAIGNHTTSITFRLVTGTIRIHLRAVEIQWSC